MRGSSEDGEVVSVAVFFVCPRRDRGSAIAFPRRGRRTASRRAGHGSVAQLDRHGLDPPDRIAVLANRPIGRKLAGTRHVHDRHLRPAAAVAERAVDLGLRVDVGAVVRQQQEGIVVEQVIDQRAEQSGIPARERTAGDQVDRRAQLGVAARSNRAAGSRGTGAGSLPRWSSPNRKKLSAPTSSRISTLAPSSVPIVSAPFSVNFMLPVPEASLPAVEICSDRSAAG